MPSNGRAGRHSGGRPLGLIGRSPRERILEAAITLYVEQGISGTTMRQVAERADVAPGTLRNHFPSRELLDRAMVERLQAEAPVPAPSIFDGAADIGARLHRLIAVTGRFLDQAVRLYRMWLREPMLTDPWVEAGAVYGAAWERLMRAALGRLADDAEAMAVLRAVLQPTFFDSIRAGSRATDEASELIAAVVVPWFAARDVSSVG